MWDMQRKVIWITCISPQPKEQRDSSRLPTLLSLHRPYPHHSVTSPPFPHLSSCLSPKEIRELFSLAQRRKRELCLFAGREIIVKGLIRVHGSHLLFTAFLSVASWSTTTHYSCCGFLWHHFSAWIAVNHQMNTICILGISLYLYFLLSSFSSVQSLSGVRLFATPWIAARQASLSITNSWSLPELMSIESVMPSSHLILCRPLLLLPPIPPNIRVFSKWVNSSLEVAKVLEFQLQHQSFQWTPRTDFL